jgi:hypothetical protein
MFVVTTPFVIRHAEVNIASPSSYVIIVRRILSRVKVEPADIDRDSEIGIPLSHQAVY